MAIWSAEIKELEKLHESFGVQLPDLEKELGKLIKADDENMILLYSRRCLEVIIADLCECELKRDRGSEPLKGIIDKLNKEKKVPSNIITSMDHLNGLSSYGAHPKDFDPEQVKPVLVNLDIIIKWYLKYKSINVKLKEERKIQFEGGKPEEIKKQFEIDQQEKPAKLIKNRLLSGVAITTVLVIAGILLYPKIFKSNSLERLRSSGERISIAVMPFQNMTNDTTWDVWQDGIQNELITSLTNSEELKVRQAESISSLIQAKGLTNYASITPSIAGKISQNLDANVFIYGSIKQVGKTIRVNAQVVDSKTEDVLKSFQLDGIAENILPLIDSLSIMAKNYIIISELKKELPVGFRYYGSTNSLEAFRYFIYGQKAFHKGDFSNSAKLFSQAIAIDSNFVSAVFGLTYSYFNQGWYDERYYEEAKKWCVRLYKKREQMPMEQKISTNKLYASFFGTPYEEIEYVRQIRELDDQSPNTYYSLGYLYYKLFQFDKAIPEFEKALEIYKKWGSKPKWVYNYTYLGMGFIETGQFKKAKKLFEKAEQDFPDNLSLIMSKAVLSLVEKDTVSANKYIEKYISIHTSNTPSEVDVVLDLAFLYGEAGILDKAEEYYRKALSLQPENPIIMNFLAYLLIEKEININEGLEVVDKALEINPENSAILDTKGWGLYKLGKYEEALKLLERSWELKPIYNHEIYLHLEEAKKAVASKEKN